MIKIMPYRKEDLVTGNYFHVFNRRSDGLTLFKKDRDFLRFLISAFIINTVKSRPNHLSRWSNGRMVAVLDGQELLPKKWIKRTNYLVNIGCFILMNNHPHFLLKQVSDGGIQEFMERLANSYVKFFNIKYERKGPLFESPFKAVPVIDDLHLRYLLGYIPLNALDVTNIEWRKTSLRISWQEVAPILDSYKWSSYHSFMGKKDFSALVGDSLIEKIFSTAKDFERHLKSWNGEDYLDKLVNT